MKMRSCPECGSAVGSEANFCAACGAQLVRSDAEDTQAHPIVISEPGEVAMLVVTKGPSAGSRFPVSAPRTTIGRHPDSTIFLDDVSVSRRHAEITVDGSRLKLADSHSLNGTYLNARRVDFAELAEGDQIQIGRFRLVVVMGVPGESE